MIPVLGCGACCYRAKVLLLKENTIRKRQLIICPNPEKEVDKLIARKDFLLKRGENLNRGHIQFLKDMDNKGERKRLMKKLLAANLPLSNNVKRDLEIGAEIHPLPPLLPPYAVIDPVVPD